MPKNDLMLCWHRAGPREYTAVLPDGRHARVSGDDCGYPMGWQWRAQIDSEVIGYVTFDKCGDAKAAVQHVVDTIAHAADHED